MNLIEKLLASKSKGGVGDDGVKPGQLLLLEVDWVVASELAFFAIDRTYTELGRPDLIHPERLWLAADHRVDPRNMHEERVQKILAPSERIAAEHPSVDYHGPNQTIIHTEFYRERAQPGQFIIGADSHTCSAGGLGAFAMGLGVVDAVIPLLTSETWIEVPEVVRINFIGRPKPGIGGKDIILYILNELKRNTVTNERAVEYGGPGCKHLSSDARFAISNMTTELGGIAGVFEPDAITAAYLRRRKSSKHTTKAVYYKADADAKYSFVRDIDLNLVSPLVALYPNPDNCVPAKELEEEGSLLNQLDGVFIGACTTTEEDLILAALVLEEGMKQGLSPKVNGHRKVTPGSVQIIKRLSDLGLIKVYQDAGFDVEPPGCSYCTGAAFAKAAPGEVWLSSQNRNFKNRMGKGAFGSISSAATVAASSFEMKLRDPGFLVDKIDMERYNLMRQIKLEEQSPNPTYAPTPRGHVDLHESSHGVNQVKDGVTESLELEISEGIYRMGDNIDTDAIIAVEFLHLSDVGAHLFEHFVPEAREDIKGGRNIVVADKNFGCGSSRETAVAALQQAGVKAVIAKSFSYIFHRNCPNLSLLSIVVTDEKFYAAVDAHPNGNLTISLARRVIKVGNLEFKFQLSAIELSLFLGGGVVQMYRSRGAKLFHKSSRGAQEVSGDEVKSPLAW